jgi:hypothetical protein
MNAATPGRSRAFWLGGFLFLFLLHAFGIFIYGERNKAPIPWQRPKPFLHIGGNALTDRRTRPDFVRTATPAWLLGVRMAQVSTRDSCTKQLVSSAGVAAAAGRTIRRDTA